jgi:hypothetical protein
MIFFYKISSGHGKELETKFIISALAPGGNYFGSTALVYSGRGLLTTGNVDFVIWPD